MNITLILALDEKGCIGKDNHLPWELADDLKHFKETTINHPIIMGSNTFESLPNILPNREHLVLSGSMRIQESKNVKVFESIPDILDYIDKKEYEDVFLIGGLQTVKDFSDLKFIDDYILTHINAKVDGDTFIDLEKDLQISTWSVYYEKEYKKDDKNEYDFTIRKYFKRIKRFYE